MVSATFDVRDLLGRMSRRAICTQPLTVAQILEWADAYHAETGQWPTPVSGPVRGVPGELWANVQYALQRGRRGLPGGDTLPRLLRRHGRIGERRGRPPQPERHQLTARLHAEGLTAAEIGRRLGVSRQAAWEMLKRTSPALVPAAC
jgi:hypothetical protein